MKKIRLICAAGMVFVMAVMPVACANKGSTDFSANGRAGGEITNEEQSLEESATTDGSYGGKADYDVRGESGSATASPEESGEDTGEDTGLTSSSSITVGAAAAAQQQDKIIRTFYMDVETQEFDSLITWLDSEIGRLNGYVESSKISGRSYYDSEGARYASITVRIPQDSVGEFVNSVDESANIVNKQESTDNVSLEYADIESRKKALEIEQERLFALLEKTDTMENIVTLESRLSDIRYELQNYETTLRTYDNKVEYSTVALGIREVEKLTPAVEIKQSVGSRIKNGFSDTMYRLNEGLKNFFVWFVVNLPYLIIWGIVIAAAVLIIRGILKKRRRKNLPPQPPADQTTLP